MNCHSFNVFMVLCRCWSSSPYVIKHTEQYSELINYLVRHYAKPGITGGRKLMVSRREKELIEMRDRVIMIFGILKTELLLT
jgi:hypothetical protein